MILLARQPSDLQKILEVVLRRLPQTHNNYAYYGERLSRVQAGLAGEQRVDAEWLEIDLPTPHIIFYMIFKPQIATDLPIKWILSFSAHIFYLFLKSKI